MTTIVGGLTTESPWSAQIELTHNDPSSAAADAAMERGYSLLRAQLGKLQVTASDSKRIVELRCAALALNPKPLP